MNTAAKLPPRGATTVNRITDVFQKLEKGKPLAAQFAGESTSGQTQYSDDPRSTWGFNFLGQVPKAKDPKPCFGSYIVRLITQLNSCQYKAAWHCVSHHESDQPDLKLVYENACWVVQAKQTEVRWIHREHPSTTMTICSVQYPHLELWSTSAGTIPPAQAVTEQAKPAVEIETTEPVEPVTYGWTRSGFAARAAARRFSEKVHGDH